MTEIQGKSVLVRVSEGSSYRESTVVRFSYQHNGKKNYEDLLPVKVLKVMFVLLFQKQKKETNDPLDTGKLLHQECTI